MAITDKEGTKLKVTEQSAPAESALPPVVEPAQEEASEIKLEYNTSAFTAASPNASDIPPRADLGTIFPAGVFGVHGRRGGTRPQAVAAFPGAYSPRYFRNSPEEVAYSQFFKETMYSSEVFFSSYIMDLIQVVRNKSGNEEHEKDALEDAVLLLQALRDTVQSQSSMHYRSNHPAVVDPFFPTPAIPGLKVALFGEVDDIVTDIPLVEYLRRLAQSHSPLAMNPCIMSFEGGAEIRVAITANKEDEGYHIVVIPQPEDLLNAIIKGELKVN